MESQVQSDRFREVFDEAVELPADQREAFLHRACGDDVKLRAAVESLLSAYDRAGTFLADPAIPTDLFKAREWLAPGTRIDRYTLLQILGEGGYGTVYLAEQDPPLRRRVALKVIKPGMDTRQVIARFELERQALAMMDHANIAKVFDAGSTVTGHPYFVMELADGIPITEFCQTFELTVNQRLQLFTMICSAVHHAHEKGIVHRDLKPGNVLVVLRDGVPIPKIIDFGIAKALRPEVDGQLNEMQAQAPITLQPQLLGTPQYMSPEQARVPLGQIDWRSDVYSLGALLYEMLADVPPFDRAQFQFATYGEISHILHDIDPPIPSARLASNQTVAPQFAARQAEAKQRVPLLRGDLDRIVMKALEKEPTARYVSAETLAADVQRYLDGQPVTASGPPWYDRIHRATRRRRRRIQIAAVILLALLLGIAITLLSLRYMPAASSSPQPPRQMAGADATRVDGDQIASAAPNPAEPARADAVQSDSGPSPSAIQGPLEPGLIAALYSGSQFQTLKGFRVESQINDVWPTGSSPGIGVAPPHYSLRWRGILVVPSNGISAIGADADDGVRIFLDDREVVGFSRPQKFFTRAAISPGRHAIEVEYWNVLAGGRMQLLWIPTGPGAEEQIVPAGALFHLKDADVDGETSGPAAN